MSEDELPEGWGDLPFGDLLVDSQNGCSARAGTGTPTVVLRLADVSINGTVASTGLRRIPLDAKARSKYSLEVGDLLAFRVNGSPGIAGRVICYPGPPAHAYCDHFIRFRIDQRLVNPPFVALGFQVPSVRRQVEAAMVSSAGQNTVSQASYRDIEFPVPPLAEQRRIVEKVEALLAQVNAARARLAKVPTILKRFRQSILSAACSGRLTDTGDDDEWTSTDLQSIATIGTGSTPLRSNKTFYAGKGTPWITSAATSLPVVTHADEFVTEAAVSAHRLKKYPIGTLLVAMYGEGKTRGQVTELGIEATVNQACSAIVVDSSKALRGFVKLVLQANYLSMRELAEGGNQPNLSLGKMKELPISLPPLAEQHEIVRRVDALFKLAEAIEARMAVATARADKITQAILAKAFRGELVPTEAELARQEGRGYEPASALLARIRATHASPRPKPKRDRSARSR